MNSLTKEEEATLIDLLARCSTPTEVVRQALKADACTLYLMFGKNEVIVRDLNAHPSGYLRDITHLARNSRA